MGVTELVFELLKLRVCLACHIVAMVTCYIKRMTITCVLIIELCYDTIFVVSTDKKWL